MATRRQVQAAKRNVGKAQRAARSKRTIANLPASTRGELGKQAAKARRRGAARVTRSRTAPGRSSTSWQRSGTSGAARRWAGGT